MDLASSRGSRCHCGCVEVVVIPKAHARDELISRCEKAAPWCARSFRALHAMRISVAIHKASASEILETIQLDVASNVAHGELA